MNKAEEKIRNFIIHITLIEVIFGHPISYLDRYMIVLRAEG